MSSKIRLIPASLLAGVFMFISTSPAAYPAELTVKPGKFDHFVIKNPEKAIAGEETIIRLEAVDAFGNIIANFHETGKNFTLSVNGFAAVNPQLLKSSAFASGAANVSLTDKVAERIHLSVAEQGNAVGAVIKEITILPGPLQSFLVRGPVSVQAGTKFDIELTGKDMFDNTVLQPINGKNISLTFKGEAEPRVDADRIPDFVNGKCIVKLLSNRAGRFSIEARDINTGSSGLSNNIEIINAPLHSFKIVGPEQITAGEPFEISVFAVDSFDNPIVNLSSTQGNILLAMGKIKPVQTSIPSYKFVAGQSKIELHYDAAENIIVTVLDEGKKYQGRSNEIKVIPAAPAKYAVKTPDVAVAGQKFKMQLTAYNQAGNVMRNYNLVGPDVALATNGTGTLVPQRVPAAEFIDGSAVVEAQYDKSESFSISASPALGLQQPLPLKASKKDKSTAPRKKEVKKADTEGKAVLQKETPKSPKTSAMPKSFELTDMQIHEEKDKTVLSIQIPNIDRTFSYKVSYETSRGKKKIILKTKPVVNKMTAPFASNSSFISQVTVSEDSADKEALLVIVVPAKPMAFHVAKGKDSLNVILKHK